MPLGKGNEGRWMLYWTIWFFGRIWIFHHVHLLLFPSNFTKDREEGIYLFLALKYECVWIKIWKKISFKIGDILKGKGEWKDLSHLRTAGSSVNMQSITLIFSLREKAQGEVVLTAPWTGLTTSNISWPWALCHTAPSDYNLPSQATGFSEEKVLHI